MPEGSLLMKIFLIDLVIILAMLNYVENSAMTCDDLSAGELAQKIKGNTIPQIPSIDINATAIIDIENPENKTGFDLIAHWIWQLLTVIVVLILFIINFVIGTVNLGSGFVNLVLKFISLVDIMFSFPECTGIPVELSLIIFSPIVIIVSYVVVRMVKP